ncbi:uncharacterized protein ces2b isoform X1 [Colossoma macropomum]|uniref:uncharacterized protein ces2b isoform X1 n=1 Tax=Colossoma macropomum TaxID=42526 RepID=UPI001864DDCC|nr:uncharacterized protein ces2b isoform X1 [Colossoma macropomum]
MGTLTLLLWTVTGAALLNPATAHDGPVVQTKLGALKGEYVTAKGKDTVVHSYLGVPFAKPPLGPLRLAPPQPAEAWEGVRDATQQPHFCIQNRRGIMNLLEKTFATMEVPEVSEDCLYLNIYTPSTPGENTKLPVMVWIHGGGFILGGASLQDGSVLAAYQNVVVVIIQYRLGLFGYFSTGDEHAPGNYGLLDQVAALHWVQENIHSFGGDPGAVTIFGESAGGVSVSLQILSPMSAGLFHFAIAESGTAAMGALMTDNPLPMAQQVANASGCDISSTKKMVDCVMQLSAEDILKTTQRMAVSFLVTKDGEFLPKSVHELLQNKEFKKVPFIVGVNDDESGYTLMDFLASPGWIDGMNREQVASALPYFFPDPSEKWVHEVVLNEYLGSTDDPIKIRDGVREMYGDLMFNIPARKLAKYHKGSGAPVFLYEFQHTYSEIKKRRPSFVGSDHADELHFVFGSCFANAHIKISGQFTEKENELCRTMMHYWGNFARTGSPNGPGLTPWPEYGTEAEYLGIGLEQKAGKNLKGTHYTFMTETLPRLIREKKKGPVVQTKLGALKGEYVTAEGTDTVVHSYLGVPFAKPPVGPLRLAPPQPAEAWEGVRDATQQPRVCIQHRALLVGFAQHFLMNFEVPEMSEDCLYLNIYTPSEPGKDAKLPVMVWIHGGALALGSASMQDGSVLAAYQNVVVVVIQYRLGLLGFFSTGDVHAPGNYGLLDQVAALQWVQENIHSFGGDPGAVTIFGESAGGVSVSLQILSPLSAGLFRSAIAESGTAAMDAIMTDNPLPIAQHLAEVSGCDISSTKKMVDCVMQLSEEDLHRVAETEELISVKVPKDGRFLPKSVYELLKYKQFNKVPLITGVTDDDGGYLLINFLLRPGWTDGISREQVMSIMPFFFSGPSEVHEVVLNEYLGSTDDPIEIRDGLREMYGDLMFNIPARKLAKYHKDSGAPVYLYEFQHTYSEIKKRRPSFVGSDHADELHFVFGSCFANAHIKISGQFTEKENELCRTVMHYWGNFARTGSPNGPGLTPWPEYGTEAEYLGIGLEQKADKNLKGKHYTFMSETLPRLIREKTGGPVVQTKLGALKGEYLTAKGTDTVVHSYLGVPFAKPPVGPLRLAPPQPAEAWEGVRDATQQPRVCIQHRALLVGALQHVLMNFEVPEMSEDCLYLNIYTPSEPGEDAKLPVMFWIHGGGFTVGSASMQDGSVLAAYQNVVVVVIQYRLGLLGFFSTGDEHAPGNYGLLDQVAALQWVQENIHSFGGDPGAVTIFGESAGGISVSLQILSPLSAGLFRSAIAESGTATMGALMTDNPLPIAQHLAEVSGCDISSTKKMVDCVMQLSEEDLHRVAETEELISVKVPKDGRFLPKSVYELLKYKQFNKVPLITGVTDDDGGYSLINFLLHPGWTDGISREQVMSIMPFFFSGQSEKWVHEVVLNEYLGSTDDPIEIRDGLREMYGDLMFNIPARKLAKYHRDSGAPVYLYEFQHTYSEIKKRRPSFVGSDHGDEINFVFGSCFANAHIKISGQFTEKENELCRTVMHYWGNFARTGSPNGPGLTPWPEYGTEAEYLGIGLEQKADKNLKGKHYTFMSETLPRLIREKTGGPVVQTKLGALKGEYLTAEGTDTVVHSYLGVPFAKPPVGPLRLAPPQPVEAWEGVRDATQQPRVCIQHRVILEVVFQHFFKNFEVPEMSEDCLYLNIYTPSKPGEDAKLPVMVWIHGGALALGSASMQDGSVLAAYQSVVVVVIQYRLGLLGFFSTGDEHAPGNYGLLDQVAALQWVQENIHSFGGDPGAVTIFGESAGGVSVSLQILSPLSAGLFRSAIAESGTAAMDAIMTDNPLPIAQHLAEVSGCDISNTKKMVDCVMQLSEEDLQRVAETEGLFSVKVPKDGRFLPKSVYELLKNKQFNKVPLITGVTDDDGGYSLINAHLPPVWTDGVNREQVMSIMPFFFSGPSEVHEVVLNEYLGSTDDPIKIRDGLREMYGDLMFNIPARKLAKYHRDSGAPVYLYEFQHTYNEIKKRRPSFVGSDHADELHFVFGSCFANAHSRISGQFTEKENDLCRTVMAYWGNFARTGSPNGPGLTPWPEYGTEGEYLGIGLEQKAGKNLKGKHYTFMTETVSRLIREKKDGPVVKTKLGALKGEYLTAKGKDTVVHSYLGVPFAKPPVGPLRLALPQPAEAWEGVRDATQQPHMCIQNRQMLADLLANFILRVELPEMSEDCLYLNIYTAAKPGEDANLPVMVWIHGGGLSMGSASMYDGSILSAYQNVVVVLIQYRLGLLGFFSTGDEHAPGNYGLLDQVAALQWVQENIHNFGGDPGSVTIFGESAGGASVSFLLLSPLSAGLFHRAVAQSGCATMARIVADPLPVAQQVANASGCDISSTQKIAECIKQWSTEDMITISKEHFMLHFVVTEDKAFLPKPVEELLQNQEFSKVPLLIGINDDEYGWMMPSFIGPPGWADGMDREQVLSSVAAFMPDVKKQWINELIADEYLGSSADQIKIRDSYREMMADIIFNIPALKLAKFHKGAGAPVYLYQFQQPPSFIQAQRPSFVRTDHGDDLFFVFGLCFGNAHVKTTASVTEIEKELCRTVMAYWGNFARTGSPNGPDLTPWPEYGAEAEYLGIGLEQKPGRNLKAKRYIFMTEKLPELVRSAQEKREHTEL